jgi:hypothetical protein
MGIFANLPHMSYFLQLQHHVDKCLDDESDDKTQQQQQQEEEESVYASLFSP